MNNRQSRIADRLVRVLTTESFSIPNPLEYIRNAILGTDFTHFHPKAIDNMKLRTPERAPKAPRKHRPFPSWHRPFDVTDPIESMRHYVTPEDSDPYGTRFSPRVLDQIKLREPEGGKSGLRRSTSLPSNPLRRIKGTNTLRRQWDSKGRFNTELHPKEPVKSDGRPKRNAKLRPGFSKPVPLPRRKRGTGAVNVFTPGTSQRAEPATPKSSDHLPTPPPDRKIAVSSDSAGVSRPAPKPVASNTLRTRPDYSDERKPFAWKERKYGARPPLE